MQALFYFCCDLQEMKSVLVTVKVKRNKKAFSFSQVLQGNNNGQGHRGSWSAGNHKRNNKSDNNGSSHVIVAILATKTHHFPPPPSPIHPCTRKILIIRSSRAAVPNLFPSQDRRKVLILPMGWIRANLLHGGRREHDPAPMQLQGVRDISRSQSGCTAGGGTRVWPSLDTDVWGLGIGSWEGLLSYHQFPDLWRALQARYHGSLGHIWLRG